MEAFSTLFEALVLVNHGRMSTTGGSNNTVRPHSALGYLTPTDYPGLNHSPTL